MRATNVRNSILQDVVIGCSPLWEIGCYADGINVQNSDTRNAELRYGQTQAVRRVQRKVKADAVIWKSRLVGQDRRKNVRVGKQHVAVTVIFAGRQTGKG